MAKKKTTKTDNLPLVTCGECSHFDRDTSGPSRNVYTHEYFMGICRKDLHPDTDIKQFANKPRHCAEYRRNENG